MYSTDSGFTADTLTELSRTIAQHYFDREATRIPKIEYIVSGEEENLLFTCIVDMVQEDAEEYFESLQDNHSDNVSYDNECSTLIDDRF